jgi:hypothetical protein
MGETTLSVPSDQGSLGDFAAIEIDGERDVALAGIASKLVLSRNR